MLVPFPMKLPVFMRPRSLLMPPSFSVLTHYSVARKDENLATLPIYKGVGKVVRITKTRKKENAK